MKLQSCHIENFGILHETDFDFSSGLTVICRENGWGKSTLAAFIKAMFYGLDTRGLRKKEERKKYKPWQGGVYGGSLTFEQSGTVYTVSRVFGAKETEDECEIREEKTNLVVDCFSDRLGEELFGIDKASFSRTVFLAQNDCETLATDDINAKLGNLTDSTDDLNNYETADETLKKIMNSLTPRRSTGSLNKRKAQITACEREVRDGEILDDRIRAEQNNYDREAQRFQELRQERDHLNEKQAQVSEILAIRTKQETWNRMRENVSGLQKEEEMIRQRFPGEIPARDQLERNREQCRQMERIREKMESYQMSPEQKREWIRLSEIFERYPITEDDFVEKERALASMSALWEERNKRKSVLPAREATVEALRTSIQMQRQERQNEGKKNAKRMLTGIGLAVAGLVLFFVSLLVKSMAWGQWPGIGMTLCGVALVFFSLAFRPDPDSSTEGDQPDELLCLCEQMKEDQNYLQKTDCKMAEFLELHGRRFDEMTVSMSLQELMRELYNLRNDKKKYEDLSGLRDQYRLAEREYEKLLLEINTFLETYQFVAESDLMAQLEQIQRNLDLYEAKKQELKKADEERKEWEKKEDVESFIQSVPDDLPSFEQLAEQMEAVSDEMTKVHRAMTDYSSRLNQLQEQYDEWEEKKIRLKELRECQEREKKKFDCVSLARNYLGSAKETMTAKYTEPVMKNFRNYYQILMRSEPGAYRMDANSNLTVEECGKQREVRLLSAGYRDLIGVCLRLAFSDAMFTGDPPVLVLDDPFVNLDDGKQKMVQDLLEEVTGRYQVIYFTCSEKRIPDQ